MLSLLLGKYIFIYSARILIENSQEITLFQYEFLIFIMSFLLVFIIAEQLTSEYVTDKMNFVLISNTCIGSLLFLRVINTFN